MIGLQGGRLSSHVEYLEPCDASSSRIIFHGQRKACYVEDQVKDTLLEGAIAWIEHAQG